MPTKGPGYFPSYRLVFQRIVREFNPYQCLIIFALQHAARGNDQGPKVHIPGQKRRRSLLIGEGVTSYARLSQDSGVCMSTVKRLLYGIVEKLPWIKTQVAKRGHKEWGGIYFRLDFRKMCLWGGVTTHLYRCLSDTDSIGVSQIPTSETPTIGVPETPTGPQSVSQRPPSETLRPNRSLNRGPLVVSGVLGDKTLDQRACTAFGALFASWKTNGDGFTSWQMLSELLRQRLREDPKRTLAHSYYVGAYKNPRCRLSMLIARLSRHWAKDPPSEHMETARDAMTTSRTGKREPTQLAEVFKDTEGK